MELTEYEYGLPRVITLDRNDDNNSYDLEEKDNLQYNEPWFKSDNEPTKRAFEALGKRFIEKRAFEALGKRGLFQKHAFEALGKRFFEAKTRRAFEALGRK